MWRKQLRALVVSAIKRWRLFTPEMHCFYFMLSADTFIVDKLETQNDKKPKRVVILYRVRGKLISITVYK